MLGDMSKRVANSVPLASEPGQKGYGARQGCLLAGRTRERATIRSRETCLRGVAMLLAAAVLKRPGCARADTTMVMQVQRPYKKARMVTYNGIQGRREPSEG